MISHTYGKVNISEMTKIISDFIYNILINDKSAKFEFFIGTDSQKYRENIIYVTSLAVHYIGHYGIFFIDKQIKTNIYSMQERLFNEAVYSLEFATKFLKEVSKFNLNKFINLKTLEIHVDFGNNGLSKEMIPSAIGMLKGAGFIVKYKPDSCCASIIADKFTKNSDPVSRKQRRALKHNNIIKNKIKGKA
jgi:predicted RNase H-related nuclease YkuK (DUF458 family)